MTARLRRGAASAAAAVALLGGLAACGGSADEPASNGNGTATVLRLGYFPNITHATPLVGVAKGFYTKRLGSATKLETQTFNAGPAEIEAMVSGGLDAGYIGPNPAINAWAKQQGSIRIIAGATSGGASLVVQPGINSAADLKGKRLASPQLGNTQDVALRAWLKKNGLTPSSQQAKGDVEVEPTDNATTLQLFQDKKIDGAWVPEPWASRLVLDGGGKVLVDEKTLWPAGKFVTTHLIVRADYLQKYPETVKALLQGQVDTVDWIGKNTTDAKTTANGEIARITKKGLKQNVLDRAWSNIQITNDPVAASLKKSAGDAVSVGLLKPVELKGIYDLSVLRSVLPPGSAAIDDAGLGQGG